MAVGFFIGLVVFYAMPVHFETLLVAGLGGGVAGLNVDEVLRLAKMGDQLNR